MLEPLAPSDFLGKSWEMSSSPQNPGNHRQRILGISGIFASSDASFAGAPITPRERCHVTQPRARINVGCGPQRGDRGSGEPPKRGRRRTAKDSEGQRRTAKGGCQTWVPGAEQDGTGRERDSIALKSLPSSNFYSTRPLNFGARAR